jgi:hypothetical protein
MECVIFMGEGRKEVIPLLTGEIPWRMRRSSRVVNVTASGLCATALLMLRAPVPQR